MSTLRYTDGDVTVTVDGVDSILRRVLDAAGGETVRQLEAAAEEVRVEAQAEWYGGSRGVTKRTGESGVIGTITTVTPDTVRVSVGSVDLAKAKYVHRPGPLSTTVERISRAEYDEIKRGATPSIAFRSVRGRKQEGVEPGGHYKRVVNPKASDGKYLLPELVTTPARRRARQIVRELGAAIAKQAGGA